MAAAESGEDKNAHYLELIKTLILENKHVPQLQVLATQIDEIETEDISSPFVNIVWRVFYTEKSGDKKRHSVIVKIALPVLNFFTPPKPVSKKRQEVECLCLKKFNDIIPGSAPEIYAQNVEKHIFIMEDLHDHTLQYMELKEGRVNLEITERIARTLAQIHKATHIATLSEEAFTKLKQDFMNDDYADVLYKQLQYDGMFERDKCIQYITPGIMPIAEKVWTDPVIQQQKEKILDIYLNKKECLTHGDFHPGSVMLRDGIPKFFDGEGARVCVPGQDLASQLAGFITCYQTHLAGSKDAEKEEERQLHKQAVNKLVDAFFAYYKAYFDHLTCSIGERDVYVGQVLSDTVGLSAIRVMALPMLVGKKLLGSEERCVTLIEIAIDLMKKFESVRDIDTFADIAAMKKI